MNPALSALPLSQSPHLNPPTQQSQPRRPAQHINRGAFAFPLALLLLTAALTPIALAQGDKPASDHPAAATERPPNTDPMKFFYLKNAGQPNDGNEILTGVRLILDPSVKLYLVPSQNILVVRGKPDQLVLAQKLIDELDRPARIYRLTYTVAESDSGKRVGVQHFALVIHAGQRTTLKEGSKIPIATGQYGAPNVPEKASEVQTQFTYLDIGMNFDATLANDGMTLTSKVEQSSVGGQTTISNVTEPIIRQSVLTNTSTLTLGKPETLGGIDVPGSTRHLDIEVLLEPVP